jgi:DNA-binding beta-propeller fold protein YncE
MRRVALAALGILLLPAACGQGSDDATTEEAAVHADASSDSGAVSTSRGDATDDRHAIRDGGSAEATEGGPKTKLDGPILYVAMDDGTMDAFKEGTWENVGHWEGLPITDGVRGIDADPASGMLFIAHGETSAAGPGGLLAWSLTNEAKKYDVAYGHGVDQQAYGDGKIWMPSGELTYESTIYVIDAENGQEIGTEQGGFRPHNEVFKNGHRYSGGLYDDYLRVSGGTGAAAVGPTPAPHTGVRPFVINAAETRAWMTWTQYRGFSVADLQTGAIITSIDFGPIPAGYGITASHGISLSPDGTEIYVLDTPFHAVRVYDSSDDPQLKATIALDHHIRPGMESPCAHGCEKSGWLLHFRDGRYVLVGDSGDVIDTQSQKVVANVAPVQNNRHGYIEIDWSDGVPVATSTHFGSDR